MITGKSLLREEIYDALIDSDLVKHMPIEEVRALTRYFGFNTLKEDEIIFKEGDRGTFLAVIASGAVAVRKSNLDNKSVTLAILHKGKVFGEMALLDGEWRSASCIASENCTLATLSQDSLEQMTEENPKMAVHLLRSLAIALSRRLRIADGRLVDTQPEDEEKGN